MRIVRYRRARIVVPDAPPLKGICECCGKKAKTQTHHFVYKYKTKEVKANPRLALENTAELCFNPCHKVADAMRVWINADEELRKRLTKLYITHR